MGIQQMHHSWNSYQKFPQTNRPLGGQGIWKTERHTMWEQMLVEFLIHSELQSYDWNEHMHKGKIKTKVILVRFQLWIPKADMAECIGQVRT